MANILDRSNSYLRIFTENIKIDHNLPKWRIMDDKIIKEGNDTDIVNNDGSINVGSSITSLSNVTIIGGKQLPNREKEREISLNDLINLDSKDFNIVVSSNVATDIMSTNNFNSFLITEPIEDDSFGDTISKEYRKKGIFSIVYKNVKKFFNDSKDVNKEPVYEFDAIEFFNQVKLTTKENERKYAERLEPYLIAMKQAKEMGQQALVDKLVKELFTIKYESILYTEGFDCKITEEQLVDFVKKAEKGVQLCYISNFTRPIPQDVFETKKKADELLVFDNYCVLYYDPQNKAYKQTEKEAEAERKKKSDPILFGMISGSRNLYYITDWVDDYCDLTLDEFIKVSGLDKQHIKIDEKIKF